MDQKQVGLFIAQLRREKNLTQEQLGEQVGVTNKTVSRWENGNYMPDLATLQILCAELDVSVNELLSGQRLDDGQFRRKADENLLCSMQQLKAMQRLKFVSQSFAAAGVGFLCAVAINPDIGRRILTLAAAVLLIGVGWMLQAHYDKQLDRYFYKKEELQ